MSVISVYRTFFWTKDRLAGQTGYVWETKEQQARCIKDPPDGMMLTSGLQPAQPYIPPTKERQLQDARYHIEHQQCLCGIFGYFSPNYLALQMASGTGPGAVDRDGETVFARIRLGGLVDIHGMGARGEYGLIEEAWCDEAGIAEAIAKQYDIPVNQSDYKGQPRTDPILSGEAKIVKMAPMFAGMPEAMGMQTGLGQPFTLPRSVGAKFTTTPKVVRSGPGQGQAVASLFGQPLTFKQYMHIMSGGTPAAPTNPFGNLSSPFPPGQGLPPSRGLQSAGGAGYAPPLPSSFGVPPPWTSQQMRSVWNAKYSPPAACSAPSGSNCQCGACTGALWKCHMCGTYEIQPSDHTASKCLAALPAKLLPVVPGSIGVDKAYKPGIITRFKRALGF